MKLLLCILKVINMLLETMMSKNPHKLVNSTSGWKSTTSIYISLKMTNMKEQFFKAVNEDIVLIRVVENIRSLVWKS